MKKIILLNILLCILLTGCDSSDTYDIYESKEELVTITFSPYTMEEMVHTTRAAQAIFSFVNYLDIWLIEGTNVQTVHQTSSDDNFGTISLVLDKTKTYTLKAIAQSRNGTCTLANNIVQFPDDKPSQAFYYTTSFSPATTTSLNCTMDRIVGQFRLEITDAVPEDVTQVKFTIYNNGTRFDTSDQTAANKIDREVLYTSVSRAQDGSASFTLTILPDNLTETTNVDIKVEALKANNDVKEERTFTDVPIKANYKTTYRGTFFISSNMSMTFQANDWSEFDVTNY